MESAPPLQHVAIVVTGLAAAAAEPAVAAAEAFAGARDIAAAALEAERDLAVLSFAAPDLREWLHGPHRDAVAEACASGLGALSDLARPLGAGLRVLGRADRLPPALAALAALRPEAPRTLAWLLDYAGREEIVRAAERFLRERPGATLAEEEISRWLDTAGLPDPDLMITVGGPFTAPDCLVWQGSYAELWHTERPWREFHPADFADALADYRGRHRRFGR
jgi:undecaprenyl diphosphate synthase